MADFNKPEITDTYTDVLSFIEDRAFAIAKMEYDSDTNLPTNTLRYNRNNSYFEQWNGATWEAQTITGLLDDSVTTAKFRGNNDAWLRWRNAAGNADLEVLKADASDNIQLQAGAGKSISLVIGGTERWVVNSSGNFIPVADASYQVGEWNSQASVVYSLNFFGASQPTHFGTIADHAVHLVQNNSARFTLSGSALYPSADNTYDFGAASNRARTVYTTQVSSNGAYLLIDCGSDAMTLSSSTASITLNTTTIGVNIQGGTKRIIYDTNEFHALYAGNPIGGTWGLQLSVHSRGVTVGNPLGLPGSDHDGRGVLEIKNAVGVPTLNPLNGGILYVEGGALKYRGSSGTVTTIATA